LVHPREAAFLDISRPPDPLRDGFSDRAPAHFFERFDQRLLIGDQPINPSRFSVEVGRNGDLLVCRRQGDVLPICDIARKARNSSVLGQRIQPENLQSVVHEAQVCLACFLRNVICRIDAKDRDFGEIELSVRALTTNHNHRCTGVRMDMSSHGTVRAENTNLTLYSDL